MLVLAMQGGGTRGIAQAKFLQLLEDSLDVPLYNLFDLFSGVSIGGIHACILAANQAKGADLLHLYNKEVLARLFAKSSVFSFPGVFSPKYKSEGKTSVLQEALGNKQLQDVKKSILVSAYDFIHAQPYFFTNFSRNPATLASTVADIADATSAEPVYFSPKFLPHLDTYFLDGGMISATPCALALIEAIKAGYSLQKIKILSLGTGLGRQESVEFGKRSCGWGAVQWMKQGRFIEKMFAASVEASLSYCEMVLGEQNFLHIPFHVSTSAYPLDDTSPTTLDALVASAEQQFELSRTTVLGFLGKAGPSSSVYATSLDSSGAVATPQ